MSSSLPLVLVADDEPSMLELVACHLRMMEDPALEVIQASDGQEAWRLAREHLPDLVVLDVMMPGMSGWDVCKKIREDVALAHTGVVMLTGIGENLNEMTSPLFGADAYIDKPFEFGDLDEKVRDTLRSREKQRLGVVRPPHNGTTAAAQPLSEEDLPESESFDDDDTAPAAKPATKKAASSAKKTGAKKSATSKKKTGAKKSATSKKTGAKKTGAKKTATSKKTGAKKTATAKKAGAKKTATAKKAGAKKTGAKKAGAKKAAKRGR